MMISFFLNSSFASFATNNLIFESQLEVILDEVLTEEFLLLEPCLDKAWKFYNQKNYPEAIKHAQECVDLFLIDALIQQKEINEDKRCSGPTGKVTTAQKKCINDHGLLNDVSAALFVLIKCHQSQIRNATKSKKTALAKSIADEMNLASQLHRAVIWDKNGWYWSVIKAFNLRKAPITEANLKRIKDYQLEDQSNTLPENQSYEATLERITKEISDQLSQENVKALAVYSFTNVDNETLVFGNILSGDLETKLVNQSMRFKVVEREELKRIIKELELSQTPIFDKASIIQIGKLLNIDTLIVGKLSDWGDTVNINIQLIDTTTAEKFGGIRDQFSNSPDIQGMMSQVVEGK